MRLRPVGVGAQHGDASDEVHHDGQQHHAEAQQDGPVLARTQRRLRLPPVQPVILPDPQVDGPSRTQPESANRALAPMCTVAGLVPLVHSCVFLSVTIKDSTPFSSIQDNSV